MLWMCRKIEFYRDKAVSLEQQLDSYKVKVYVAEEPLVAGSVLTQEMVSEAEWHQEGGKDLFITAQDFGKTLLYDVPSGDSLYKFMCLSDTENVREVFFSATEVLGELQPGDRIDIRIRYHNAEDYLVLTDKWVETSSSGGIVLKLSEEEILLMSSALADSREYRDTRLYAVRYPAQEYRVAMELEYIPRMELLELLNQKNIKGELREALEGRLKGKNHE